MESKRDHPYWYRVAALKPRLKPQAEIHRQELRGQLWYVLQDHVTQRFHRFTPAAHLVIGLMDGRRTMDDIYALVRRRLGEEAPSQQDILHLLGKLHAADVLQTDAPLDAAEMAGRAEAVRRRQALQQFRSPLAIRVPLVDPEGFLEALRPLARPLFSPFGAVLWLGVVVSGLWLGAMNWQPMTEGVVDRVFTFQNLVLLWLLFPPVKALHEIGHGLAVKRWRGEVHEMGIMFLVFMPVPYVDASSASAFRSRWHRVVVGAAGLIVELFLAGLAMIAWVHLEPGLARAVCFNIVLIAGVSAVIFNGNPLLRFDGYYILSDLIEIPNLGSRANAYFGYLVQRFLFGIEGADNPVSARGERGWFLFYAPAALAYRMVLIYLIVVFVAQQAFYLGAALAVWAVANTLVLPLWRMARFVLFSPKVVRRRARALTVSVGAVAGLGALLFLVPLPWATTSDGVVWHAKGGEVVAGTKGIVREVVARQGATVEPSTPLLRLDEPGLDAEIAGMAARLAALTRQRLMQSAEDLAAARLTDQEIAHVRRRLAEAEARRERLLVRAAARGRLVLRRPRDLPGRYLHRGESVGHVVDDDHLVVHVAVPQDEIDIVRSRRHGVQLRFASDVAAIWRSRVIREVPLATDRPLSRALTTEGGGEILLDPQDSQDVRTLTPYFVLELAVPESASARFGERAYVLFDHGNLPLWRQIYRWLRQVFLDEFDV